MPMLKSLLLTAATVAVSGCVTTAERTAQMQAEIDEMIVVYGPACERLGFQANADQWRNCVLGLNAQKARERYFSYPRTTTCWGHRGFYSCTGW